MLVRRIARKAEDGFAAGICAGSAERIDSRQDLMNTYAMLLVIEERALKQFPLFAELFRAVGEAQTAEVFEQVAADERRHVKFCQAMGRRYAPDAASWQQAVARFRRIEAEAFRAVGLATIADALAHDLLRFGLPGRLLGRLLCRLDDHARAA
jgi:hypothetical protein